MYLEVISRKPLASPKRTPLLFVHGAWHGAWCWAEYFLDYFAENGYAAYAMDLRGHGNSSGKDRLRWTSLSDYVDDVALTVNGFPSAPVIIGHSMGGAVVQKYLETHSAPAAVLLASAPPAGIFSSSLVIARRHPGIISRVLFGLSMFPIISTPDLAREAFFSTSLPEDKLLNYFSRMQDESYRAFLDMIITNLPKPERINTSVLVLGAANDSIFKTREIEATAKAYKTSPVIFPDMAHDMMLESGWKEVADHIITWLTEKGIN
jgi:pimeloyl-ACP methyl ester carboxylesterase